MDLGDHSRDTFVVETEKEAKDLVGPVIDQEVEKGVELLGGHTCLNHVFSQMGLAYEEHKACLRRGRRTSMGVPTHSQMSTNTLLTCSSRVDAGASSEAFTAKLAETCGPTILAHDSEGKSAEDFTEQVSKGKLGKDLISMRVGLGSPKQWVVRDMTTARGCKDVVLVHTLRELLIFPYSHKVRDVIADAMDPKGKAPASIYEVVNMVSRSKTQKVHTVEPLVPTR